MRQSQNQRLIAAFDGVPLETEISKTFIQRDLHCGADSRRIQDVRYDHYFQLGFLILNRTERKDGLVFSYYRKVRASDYPAEFEEARAAYERHVAAKDRVEVPEKSSRQKKVEWFAATFHVKPKTAAQKPEPEQEWKLVP